MKKYDIFISYRRSSYESANLIATRLRAAGYSVFFDLETMRSGPFNAQLYEVIENCKDFLLVLPPSALDRCESEEDWLRLEITHAMKHNKNIIPIMLNGFVWPDKMPQGLENLSYYQALTASSVEYFDLSLEKLQKRYLHSKPKYPLVRLLKYIVTILVSFIALLAILWFTFSILSRDTCLKYATILTKDAGMVHLIAEEYHKLEKEWKKFDNAITYEINSDKLERLKNNINDKINFSEETIKQYFKISKERLEISQYQRFLLSIHGINPEEVIYSSQMSFMYFDEYMNMLNILRETIKYPDTLNRRFSLLSFEEHKSTLKIYYASLLSMLSHFPEETRTSFNELSPHWIYFPIQLYKIGEDDEYYENIINTELKLFDEIADGFEHSLEMIDSDLTDFEKILEETKELENR